MKLSFIIPIYNKEKHIERCIDSIIQSYHSNEIQVILIDDGSTDNSSNICQKYAQSDNRILFYKQENMGVSAARSVGLSKAKGEFIWFVDADDFLVEGAVETALDIIKDYSDIDIIAFQHNLIKSVNSEPAKMKQLAEPGIYPKEKIDERIVPYIFHDFRQTTQFRKPILDGFCWNKIFRTELIRSYIPDTNIVLFEDVLMVADCVSKANNIYVINSYLYNYSKEDETTTSRYRADYFYQTFLCKGYLYKYLLSKDNAYSGGVNAFVLERVIVSIMHEVRHDKPFFTSLKHIKKEMNRYCLWKLPPIMSIPPAIRLYQFLIRHRMYAVTLLVAQIYYKILG